MEVKERLEGEKPNVLVIYPDQMRFDAMGCSGNPVVKTPHIDRLAREGVRFNHAYTAFPLCCPFRASVMTGKYPHSAGMPANHYPIPLGQEFLAEIFRDHGWRTGYIGKWHLDGGIKHGYVAPHRRLGFDHFVGFNRGHTYFKSIFFRNNDPRPRTSRRYEPDYQTDHLIEFMDSCAHGGDDEPFLAMICYGLPHAPLTMPDHYASLYSPSEVPARDNTPSTHKRAPGEGAWRERARRFLAGYYGLMASVDHNVGKVLDWLDGAGLADDTLVVFVSDHGDMAGEHGRFAKKTYYEAAMRVPFIVRYPRRFDAGRVVDALVDPSVDLMPTLLETCGLPAPDGVQGTSALPLLDGSAETTREAVFYEIDKEREGPERFPIAERGVRTREWLYVRTEERGAVLFNLQDDPLETNNLVDSAAHSETVARLDAMLSEHMARTGDDWAIEAVFPPPDFQTHGEGGRYGRELLSRAIVEP